MIVFSSVARIRKFFGMIIVSLLVAVSAPAFANSSASVDIAAPLRAAQAAKQAATGGEDEQFSKLFRSWQTYEATTAASLAQASNPVYPRGFGSSVSIPSRMPVEGVRLTSGFGMRSHPVLGGRRAHRGIDLAAPTGTPILASADGMVSRADWFSSYGHYVSIEHGGQIQTRYGHMSRLNVAAGQRVRKGDVIGFVGSTGRSTGPHLHYEVRIANEAVNPLPYLQGDRSASGKAGDGVGGP